MQTISESIQKKEYQRKANECIESLQQALENSFSKIDIKLDQLLNDGFHTLNILPSQFQQEQPKINPNILFRQQDDNFPQQICLEVTTFIYTIQNEIQKKEQQYQKLQKEIQKIQENQILGQDSQIQQLTSSQTIQQISTAITTQSNLQQFTYQLIQENSIIQDQWCYAIAVNKDSSILIAGCDQQIKVFEFKLGMLNQVQILSEHEKYVYTLNFNKRSDQFISGSRDNSIIIWARNQNNLWVYQQKLNGHMSSVYCLILNDNEDLIVSGSQDSKINFWQNSNKWLCSQSITDHTDAVYGLSLNEQQNRLISYGYDYLILVIEQSQQNKWIVIQKIAVEQQGFRLCFIDNNTFTSQPYGVEYIHVFEMNVTKNQYTKMKDIPVKGGTDHCFFPQQYIKSKCILVSRNASNVSLIRKKKMDSLQPSNLLSLRLNMFMDK